MPKFIVFFFAILVCFGCQSWQLSNSSQNESHTKKQDIANNDNNQQQIAHQQANEKNEAHTDAQQNSSTNTKSSSVVDLSFSGNASSNSESASSSNNNVVSNTNEHNAVQNTENTQDTVISNSVEENIAAEATETSPTENHFSEQETIEETYMEEVEDSSSSTESSETTDSYDADSENNDMHEEDVSVETANANTSPQEDHTQQAHKAKMEQERLAKMQAEKERLAREAKMKAEQERLAKIQAEKERLAKIQAAKAEQERNRYWNSLLAKKGTYKYDIYIDKTKRGNQTTTIFEKNGDIIVKLDVNLDVSTWYYSYKFKQTSTEVWRDDVVQSYDCFQDDNGTKTNLKLKKTSSGYTMTFKGKTTTLKAPLIPGTSWNLMETYDKYPSFLLVDGGLGTTTTYSKSKIKFHNDENIKVGSSYMKCKHFSPTTGEKWSAWYSYDGTFVRYNDVVDGYLYDTILISVSR